jgi:hypothetical protein
MPTWHEEMTPSLLTPTGDFYHTPKIRIASTIEKPSFEERVAALMYSRTQNDNGTLNTMCLDCLRTIASSIESETDLELLEMRHVCPEKALAQLLAGRAAAQNAVKQP